MSWVAKFQPWNDITWLRLRDPWRGNIQLNRIHKATQCKPQFLTYNTIAKNKKVKEKTGVNSKGCFP